MARQSVAKAVPFDAALAKLSQVVTEATQAVRDAAKASVAKNSPGPKVQHKEQNTMTQTATAGPGSNTVPFQTLLDAAAEFGKQAGQGKDTQTKFLLKVADAAFQGVIDVDPNKHGDGVDDATKLSEAYVKAQTGATIFDAKAANQRKTISCSRTMIKLGMWPKGGSGEPMATLNNLLAFRQKARQNPQTAKKLDDASNMMLRFARAQIKQDQLITGNDLQSYAYKPVPDDKTVEDLWESLRKKMQNLKAGKGGLQDTDPKVDSVIRACTDRLTAIAKGRAITASTP